MISRDMTEKLREHYQHAKNFQASKYELFRDKKANLHLHYADGQKFTIPTITLRPYQIEVQKLLFLDDIKRFFLIRPRRSGKEVESWNMILQSSIVQPGLYLMIYPTNVRARMVLWDGSILMPDNSSRKFLDMIPKTLIQSVNNQEMSVKLINGSVIRVIGSDIDPDKLRGTNPLGIVISEFAYCDPRVMHILLPVLRQNGGWLICQSTFNGRNHAYFLYKNIKENPLWHCRVDSVESLVDENGNRYITDEMIDEDRKSGMPEHLIQQEYYSAVQLNEEAIYFAKQIEFLEANDRIQSDFFVPNAPVYTAWDKGRNDSNSVTMFQMDRRGHPAAIDFFESNNKTPDYYFDEARRRAATRGLYVKCHFLPHDGIERDYNTGKNTVDFGQENGETVLITPRPTRKTDAINQMRKMIYRTTFDKEKTGRLIDAMSNYSKVFDEKLGVYKDEPLHNWCSHPVDSFQTMTLAIDANMINQRAMDVVYYAQ